MLLKECHKPHPSNCLRSAIAPAAVVMATLLFLVWLSNHKQNPSQSAIAELVPKKGTSLVGLRIVDYSGNEKSLDFSELQAPLLIAFAREVDCPSCLELVISEFNRLTLRANGRKSSCLLISDDAQFCKHLRMRYNTVFPIYQVIRDQGSDLLLRLGSPCIIVTDKTGQVAAAHVVIPGEYKATESFIDSVVAIKDSPP